ncbi:geminin [Procambarus clarkii]|uniref:geminin n=1 Tax=Procambarus clarkii TaxID=6728 RepID=UPI001E67616F|nr:geminin-like [Procambarus clarkii]
MALNARQLRFATDEEAPQENRKCLGVLDCNKQNQSRLVVSSSGSLKLHTSKGKKRKSDENNDIANPKRKTKIYEDPLPVVKKKTFSTVSVQTDEAPNATIIPDKLKPSSSVTDLATNSSQVNKTINMLTSDTAPPEYWEGLAEKRRVALEKTLIENHDLHEENSCLRQEVVELKKENALLEEMVDQAKDLALLVESITGEIEPGEHKVGERKMEQV